MATNPYELVTQSILSQIDRGTLPWRRPWINLQPQSIHGHEYRGINAILLATKQFSDPRWLTFRMVQNLRGRVLKGSKSTPVVFWSMIESQNFEGEDRKVPVLRIFHVFNVEQTERLNLPELKVTRCDGMPIEAAEAVLANLPSPMLIKEGSSAYWSPSDPDSIVVPKPSLFASMDEYYSTVFHEACHWSGHSSRLNRHQSTTFGDDPYSFEELVAELGSAFLCAHCGLDNTIEQSAAYIDGWSRKLRASDPRLIVRAASQAQRATDYILGRSLQARQESGDFPHSA